MAPESWSPLMKNVQKNHQNLALPQDPGNNAHDPRTQTVRLLPPPVPLPVISVSWVTRTQHSAEVICALLFTGSLSTYVII